MQPYMIRLNKVNVEILKVKLSIEIVTLYM